MKLSSAILLLSAAPAAARVGDANIERKLAKPTDDTCVFAGNGFPSGKSLFKFNVLGRGDNWDPNSTFSPNGDNALLVELEGKVKINLLNGSAGGDAACNVCKKGNDFCIIDADATDSDGASICVADPFASSDPCDGTDSAGTCDEPATYAIFARTVGQGSASVSLCVDIDGDESKYCYVGSTEINPKKATDISQQLLTVCVGDLKVGLFDEICKDTTTGKFEVCDGSSTQTDEEYYWQYDNNGNRRAEFRFFDAQELNELAGGTCDFAVTRGGLTC